MKRIWLLPAAALVVSAAALTSTQIAWSAPEAMTWNGDTVHSFVLFKVKHMGASNAYGRFNDFTSSFQTNDAGSEITAVNFVVKAASVDTGIAKRDAHIQSPDFLSAKQFPEITFKGGMCKSIDADTTEVTGDLTLHGVTKPLTVKVNKLGTGKGLMGVETTFTIKRSDYGMTNMVGPVSDEVTLTVAVEGATK